MTKLFLHKAADAPIVVILRRAGGSKRMAWELIEWNLETDTFREGQWLMGKQMNGKYLQVSPNGKYIGYHYYFYTPDWQCHGAVSRVPNFTAIFFCPEHCGNWEQIQFTPDNNIIFSNLKLMKKRDSDLKVFTYKERKDAVPSSWLGEGPWTDPKGRVITTEEGKLLADGQVLYDTTDHVFVARAPV